jgi:glutamyl-tRNA synthetase
VLIVPLLERALGRSLSPAERARLEAAMPGLKPRAKTLVELADSARFYVASRPIPIDDKAKGLLASAKQLLDELAALLKDTDWNAAALEATVRSFADARSLKLGAAAQPLRAALTGSTASPPIFEVMAVLGRDETVARLADAAKS